MITLSIHDVRKVESRAIQDFNTFATGRPWCSRHIVVHNKDGAITEVVLFGDSRADLLLPGEKPVEGEKVPQTAPQGPSGALEPVVLTDGQADSLLEQVSQTF